MFAFIWQTLRGMYHYPTDKYYVLFGRESCYFDEEMYRTQGIDNVWDCYFEQPHTDNPPHHSEVLSEVGLLHDDFSEFRDQYMAPELRSERRYAYHDLITKNVKLLPHVQSKVDEFYQREFKNKKVLGLHCRGTDHPDKKPMHEYVKYINQHIENYDILFVCSDEEERVEYIKSVYGRKVVVYPTFRSKNEQPLHYQSSHQWSKYYIGEDVIVEAYLLSKVDRLLCCTSSNVNYFVRALSPTIPFTIFNELTQ